MSVQRILVATLFDGDQFLKEKVLTIDAGVITAIDDKTNNVDETLSGLITPVSYTHLTLPTNREV